MCSCLLLQQLLLVVCIVVKMGMALPAGGRPEEAANSAAGRFYDEKLERHVERIADQIVAFNVHHQHNAAPVDEDEGMQSDQPQPGFVNNSQHEQMLRQRQQEYRSAEDRDKLAMTNTIKDKVLSFISSKGNGSNSSGERDRSFYANCEQAKSSEENDDLMKLYFTLSQLEDTIAVANLRLYRKTMANQTASDNGGDVPCAVLNRNDNANAEAEKVYRVTVYYHVKGAKKHKLKKKIGDSRVITESMSYVNLNVLQGVRELNKGKLFGVIVQIEDQYGTIVKANDFFKGPTCTVGMPTAQPLPTVFEEAHTNFGRITNAADFVRKPVPPKLDVKTVQEGSDAATGASTSTRCKHLRHSHSHHQRPPKIEGAIVVSKAGGLNYNVDMNELKLMLDRQLRESNANRHQQFGGTTT